MVLRSAFPIVAFIFSLGSAQGAELAWPKLLNGETLSECRAALNLARDAFNSSEFKLSPLHRLPNDFGSELVTMQNTGSGGPLADPKLFASNPLPDMQHKNYFWQIDTHHGERLVLEEVISGMHDSYALFAVDARLDKAGFEL